MTETQHIATANIITSICSIVNPFHAFIMGFVSHIALDIIEPQEYKVNLFDFRKDKFYIILEVIMTVILIVLSFRNTVYFFAMLGSILPDLIDGIDSLINREHYQKGTHIFPWHNTNGQVKTLSKVQTIILSIILFSLCLGRW